jgi:hypothetical protein
MKKLFFWSCPFGILNDSYIWLFISFSRFGKISSIILLTIFSILLACTSHSLFAMSKFNLLVLSKKSCMFCSYFLIFSLLFPECYNSPPLSPSPDILSFIELDPVYWWDFQPRNFFFSYWVYHFQNFILIF